MSVDEKEKETRATRNRTIDLSAAEIESYRKQLIYPEDKTDFSGFWELPKISEMIWKPQRFWECLEMMYEGKYFSI